MVLSLLNDTYGMIKERAEEMPDNYRSSGNKEVTTSPEIKHEEIFSQDRRYPPTPIWKLQEDNKSFRTSKPITVKIYRDNDLFFAENETLVVCGTGETPHDALQNICLHIIHFFKHYKSLDKSDLTGDALRLKELYQDLLIEE
ncbi:MAG: hypothetical protein GY941_00635 [Planctomycetes bacterium]|nr:hypothetical protein [Planctomycetota bacterium]